MVNKYQANAMGGLNAANPMLGNAQGLQGQMQGNYGQQQDYINLLQGQATGAGPSVAQELLRQQTQANNANAASMIGSQRGMNPGLQAKLIMDRQAQQQQQAAGQGSLLRAQEMTSARGMLGSALGQQAQTGFGMSNANLGAGQLALGQQGQQLGDYWNAQHVNAGVAGQNADLASHAQDVNAGIAAQNAHTGAGFWGGLLSGAGSAVTSLAGASGGGAPIAALAASSGGPVPGHATAPGDSPANDHVPALLSPHEIVLPRSVTLADDAPERARDFVRAIKGRLAKPKRMADGGDVPDPSFPAGDPTQTTANYFAGRGALTPAADEPPAKQGVPELLAAGPPDAIAAPEPGARQPSYVDTIGGPLGLPRAPEAPAAPKAPANEMANASRQEIKGIEGEAAAAQDFAKHQTQVMDSWNAARAELSAKFQEQMKAHTQKSDALFAEAMNGKVNPNQYWEQMSTGGKISSAIGLILGGIGSGLTGQPNAALQVIDKAIDRDVEAQKLNIGKKVNLLSKYMEMGHGMQQAHQLASADMHDAAAAQLARTAAAYQGTKAAADAQVLIGQERQKAYQTRQQATLTDFQIRNAQLTQAMMARIAGGAAGSDPARMGLEMEFLQHPEKRAAHTVGVDEEVPVGKDANGKTLTATKTTPYLANSTEARTETAKEMRQFRGADMALKDLESFAKANPLGGNPGSEEVGDAQAAAMHLKMNYEAMMAGMNRQASPEVLKHIDSIVADPTAFFKTGKTSGALKFLRRMMNQHKQDILDTNTLGPQ